MNKKLINVLADLPILTVDAVVMWSQVHNAPASASTVENFLNKQEASLNLISQTDKLGRKYWITSDAWNRANVVAAKNRDAKIGVASLLKQGVVVINE